MHNLEVDHYVLFGASLRTYTWKTASQIALRDCFKEVREDPEYRGGVFAKKTQIVEHQKITSN